MLFVCQRRGRWTALPVRVFNVFKEFFQRSDAWLLELPVYIVPQISDYQINPCQNVVVNRLMGLGRSDNPNAVVQLCADVPPTILCGMAAPM